MDSRGPNLGCTERRDARWLFSIAHCGLKRSASRRVCGCNKDQTLPNRHSKSARASVYKELKFRTLLPSVRPTSKRQPLGAEVRSSGDVQSSRWRSEASLTGCSRDRASLSCSSHRVHLAVLIRRESSGRRTRRYIPVLSVPARLAVGCYYVALTVW